MAGDSPRRDSFSFSEIVAAREMYLWKRQSPVVRAVSFDYVVGFDLSVRILGRLSNI